MPFVAMIRGAFPCDYAPDDTEAPPEGWKTMADTLPDRLSVDPRSKYYDEALLARGVGIRFNGIERTNCSTLCARRLPIEV